MNVTILVPEIHFHAPVVMKELFDRFSDDSVKFNVIMTPKISSDKKSSASLSKVIRDSGIKYLVLMMLLKLKFDFFRLFEKIFRRSAGSKKYMSPAEVCSEYGISYIVSEKVNSPETVEHVKKTRPDIILSLFFNQILKAELLSAASGKCLNLHPSVIPAYKGMSPILWMLSDGVDKGGITLHEMTSVLDSGNIISQKEFDIKEDDSFFTVYRKAAYAGAELLADFLSSGNIGQPGTPQPEGGRIYGPITRDAMNSLLKKHSFLGFRSRDIR